MPWASRVIVVMYAPSLRSQTIRYIMYELIYRYIVFDAILDVTVPLSYPSLPSQLLLYKIRKDLLGEEVEA